MTFADFLQFLLIVFIYILPWFIAYIRGSEHESRIFLFNMVFGWTIVGWVIALIMAILDTPDLEI